MENRRPSSFSKKVANQICERLIAGESLRAICDSAGMPNKSTVFRWLDRHTEFRDQYARAREIQAEMMADELLSIADDASGDLTKGESGHVGNSAAVHRSKLRVETRKWIASRLLPKKYGEKLEVGHSGEMQIETQTVQQKLRIKLGLGVSKTPNKTSAASRLEPIQN